jgi:hypothetical protein
MLTNIIEDLESDRDNVESVIRNVKCFLRNRPEED